MGLRMGRRSRARASVHFVLSVWAEGWAERWAEGNKTKGFTKTKSQKGGVRHGWMSWRVGERGDKGGVRV
jgi:hypothetical protein